LPVDTIGELPQILGVPNGEFLTEVNLFALLPSAIAVATLAALESLLSAKIADGMADARVGHDSNRELFGQGISNLLVPFFGGVPATAALARTAVNVTSGARSRLSAASHAIFLGLAVLALPQLVAQIPIASLAGVLIATTARMIRPRELTALFRESKLDALLLAGTFVVTVLLDLISAVGLGLVVFWLLRNSRLSLKSPIETPL
ncbi:MAG: SulP family inorganic anion transporter, partial [Micrococcales bacterium]